jgi:hypothetical protein
MSLEDQIRTAFVAGADTGAYLGLSSPCSVAQSLISFERGDR